MPRRCPFFKFCAALLVSNRCPFWWLWTTYYLPSQVVSGSIPCRRAQLFVDYSPATGYNKRTHCWAGPVRGPVCEAPTVGAPQKSRRGCPIWRIPCRIVPGHAGGSRMSRPIRRQADKMPQYSGALQLVKVL